jgi:glycosyltransferase involved in cell wall biosynthesis
MILFQVGDLLVLKFKVAMVSPNPPWFPGGVERHIGELAKGLHKHVDMEIYCTTLNSSEVGTKQWEGIKTHVFKAKGSGYHYSGDLGHYLKSELECDIIHAHGFTTYIPTAAKKSRKRKAFIVTPHFHPIGSTTLYRFERKIYDPLIGKKILNSADGIICVSKTERDLLVDKFPGIKEKITIIPSGVDIRSIQEAEPFPVEGPMILYIGRMEGYKNVDMIIDALTELPSDYRLTLIGGGPEIDVLQKKTKQLNLELRVQFLGNVSDSELNRWRQSCSVFITLSDIEAFGSSVVEALAASKPVIVNNRLSLKEFAKRYPVAVSAIDIHDSDSTKLAGLIVKQVEREENIKGIKLNLEDYDWRNICSSTLELYSNIMKKE